MFLFKRHSIIFGDFYCNFTVLFEILDQENGREIALSQFIQKRVLFLDSLKDFLEIRVQSVKFRNFLSPFHGFNELFRSEIFDFMIIIFLRICGFVFFRVFVVIFGFFVRVGQFPFILYIPV